MRSMFVVLCLAAAGVALAASPDPIRLSAEDLQPAVFSESKQILLDELSAEGRYGPVPERYKRKIRESLTSIETLLADSQGASEVEAAIQAEADEINDLLARADSKVGKGRCEERKPMGSNIRLRTVCRDSATMYQQRDMAREAFRELNRCAMKGSGGGGTGC